MIKKRLSKILIHKILLYVIITKMLNILNLRLITENNKNLIIFRC